MGSQHRYAYCFTGIFSYSYLLVSLCTVDKKLIDQACTMVPMFWWLTALLVYVTARLWLRMFVVISRQLAAVCITSVRPTWSQTTLQLCLRGRSGRVDFGVVRINVESDDTPVMLDTCHRHIRGPKWGVHTLKIDVIMSHCSGDWVHCWSMWLLEWDSGGRDQQSAGSSVHDISAANVESDNNTPVMSERKVCVG